MFTDTILTMTYEEVTVSMFGSGAKKGLNMQEIDDGEHP